MYFQQPIQLSNFLLPRARQRLDARYNRFDELPFRLSRLGCVVVHLILESFRRVVAVSSYVEKLVVALCKGLGGGGGDRFGVAEGFGQAPRRSSKRDCWFGRLAVLEDVFGEFAHIASEAEDLEYVTSQPEGRQRLEAGNFVLAVDVDWSGVEGLRAGTFREVCYKYFVWTSSYLSYPIEGMKSLLQALKLMPPPL